MVSSRFTHLFEKHLLGKTEVTDLEQYPFLDAPHTDLFEAKLNNQVIALKRWRVSRASDKQTEKTLKMLVQKLDAWKLASSHPGILPFHGLFEGIGRVPALVLPKMKWNIAQYVSENPFANRFILAHQLSEALSHLHNLDPPIVHGSVQDTNVLISCDHQLSITDIGVYSTFSNPEMSQDWRPGERARFQSPEQLMGTGTGPLRPSSDVWSFGMVLLQIFTGNLPYGHLLNPNTAIIQIAQGTLPPPPDESLVSPALWKLLLCCWEINPKQRPGMSFISPWIRLLMEYDRWPKD